MGDGDGNGDAESDSDATGESHARRAPYPGADIAAEPDAAYSGASDGGAAECAATEPGAAESRAAEPGSAEPGTCRAVGDRDAPADRRTHGRAVDRRAAISDDRGRPRSHGAARSTSASHAGAGSSDTDAVVAGAVAIGPAGLPCGRLPGVVRSRAMADFQGFKTRHFAGAGIDGGGTGPPRTLEAAGGLIARELSALRGLRYEYWPADGRPEVHIARPEHYDAALGERRASLFVMLGVRPNGAAEVVYGFRVAGPEGQPGPERTTGHWNCFVSGLCRDGSVQTAMLDGMANYGLELSDYHERGGDCGALRSRFAYRDRRLQWALPEHFGWGAIDYEVLRRQVAALRDGAEPSSADLHLFAAMPADEAVGLGSDAVEPITTVLAVLAPIYEQTVRG